MNLYITMLYKINLDHNLLITSKKIMFIKEVKEFNKNIISKAQCLTSFQTNY